MRKVINTLVAALVLVTTINTWLFASENKSTNYPLNLFSWKQWVTVNWSYENNTFIINILIENRIQPRNNEKYIMAIETPNYSCEEDLSFDYKKSRYFSSCTFNITKQQALDYKKIDFRTFWYYNNNKEDKTEFRTIKLDIKYDKNFEDVNIDWSNLYVDAFSNFPNNERQYPKFYVRTWKVEQNSLQNYSFDVRILYDNNKQTFDEIYQIPLTYDVDRKEFNTVFTSERFQHVDFKKLSYYFKIYDYTDYKIRNQFSAKASGIHHKVKTIEELYEILDKQEIKPWVVTESTEVEKNKTDSKNSFELPEKVRIKIEKFILKIEKKENWNTEKIIKKLSTIRSQLEKVAKKNQNTKI